MREYGFEVWSNENKFVADISSMLTGRSFSMQRNDYETIDATINLDYLDVYSYLLGEHPRSILHPLQRNIRLSVLQDGVKDYLFGARIMESPPYLGSTDRTASISATGYLELFKNRYVDASFAAGTESTSVARGIINAVQAQSDMGITMSANQYMTGVPRERNYEGVEAKDKLQRLTMLRDGRFDFRFTADKQFETWESLGSVRNDIRFVYGENVNSASVEQVLPYNYIRGLGSGFGADQLKSIKEDVDSRNAYYRRERIEQFNSIVNQGPLDEDTAAVLEFYRDIRYIPTLQITGADLPGALIVPGDRIFLDLTPYPYTDNIIGWYRVERVEVTLDDSGFESNIKVYFDNSGLDQASFDDAA